MSRNAAEAGRALGLLREGLGPFVERQVQRFATGDQIADFRSSSPSLRGTPIREWEVSALLNLMRRLWGAVFAHTLKPAERGFVNELGGWRNKWAHEETMTSADMERALDTAVRLLRAVKAETQAAEMARLREAVLWERNRVSIGEILTAQHFTSRRRACWADALAAEFDRSYMRALRKYLIREEAEHAIFPPPEHVFAALDETALHEVKVVIIGQDPYAQRGQAHGLAFSVERGNRPMSLAKIIAEVNRDMDENLPQGHNRRAVPEGNGCLAPWADQGVLLLNAVLTVREGCPRAHRNEGWECFTDRVIEIVNERREHVVFMLWGEEAKRKGASINCNRHKILTAGHPLIGILGSRHFSCANGYLESKGLDPIDWPDVCHRPLSEEEIEDEAQWDRAFAASHPVLEQLAAEAANERRLGLTEELDPTRL